MGLRFGDALRLSFVNIAQHKGRTATTVLTISVLFGFLMGVNFLLNGVAGTLYDAATEKTQGLAYVEAGYGSGARRMFEGEKIILDETVMSENLQEKIAERVRENGGKIIGKTWSYQVDYPYKIAELSAVKDFVTGDLSEVPEGKIPVLLPEDGWRQTGTLMDESYYEEIEKDFYEVGIMPTTRKGGLDKENLRLLTPLLEMFTGFSNDFIVVDDGSGRVEEYLYNRSKEYVELARVRFEEANEGSLEEVHFVSPEMGVMTQYYVVTFDTMEKMAGYVLPKSFAGMTFYNDFGFSSQDFVSNPVTVVQSAASYKTIIKFLEVVMLVVAVIVATLTFVHLVDQDVATVALYRSLGATTGQIYIIYFLYMVEMCLLAVVVCFLMAFAMTGIVALIDGGALGLALEEYYFLDKAPAVRLFRFDRDFWTVIMAIMLVAVLGFGFSTGRFSNKNIAKKLKED